MDGSATSIARDERLLYLFLLVQFVCSAVLVLERSGALRTALRAATFCSSLGMIAVLSARTHRPHPVTRLASIALFIMALGLLHPDTNTMSGIAHLIFNVSIWAPLYWVGRLTLTSNGLWKALKLIWVFNVASAVVGVLQVYYPDYFSPSGEFVKSQLGLVAEGLQITLADGRRVWRPFGLSDTPGGAASAGSVAVILGLMFLLSRGGHAQKALAAIGIAAGMFCIYICQVRAIMVISVLSCAVLAAFQVMHGRANRLVALFVVAPLALFGGIAWTMSVGGEVVAQRVRTLAEGNPGAVYYRNRGIFVEHTLTEELPKYPVGGGLGRYGMMYSYFGDKRLRPFYVEVQLTGWLYDGGFLLVVVAYSAVIAVIYMSLRLAINKNADPIFTDCAACISALNFGWLITTASYPLFLSQGGMIFWLLNSALYMTSLRLVRTKRPQRSALAGPKLPRSVHLPQLTAGDSSDGPR